MLHFKNLSILKPYFEYTYEKIPTTSLFFVWWIIRDLLLNIHQDNITDIDISWPLAPNEILKKINKDNISVFQTEKFWTITIVPKDNKKLKFELTPFREEWNYMDFRHPSEIKRTTSLISDSKRRDFTINSLYLGYVEIAFDIPKINHLTSTSSTTIPDKFLKIYEKEKDFLLIDEIPIMILTSEIAINNLIKNNQFNIQFIKDLIKKTNTYSLQSPNFSSFNYLYILIDPQQGILDLIKRQLKAVGNPDDRFQEDALRIIRGIRFINILNQKLKKIEPSDIFSTQDFYFDFENTTRRSMKKNFFLVKFLPKERVKDEILKVFKADNPFGFVGLADELNILKYIFPSLALTKWVNQPVRYHPLDTYHHILMSVYHLQQINSHYLVKFWMLYHDVAKPDQYSVSTLWLSKEERQRLHSSYLHHPKQGADFVKQDFAQLWFSKKEIEEIARYVANHMLPGELLKTSPKNLEKKLKKLIAEVWEKKLSNLIDIAIADRLWQYNPIQDPDIKWLYKIKDIIKQIIKQQWEFKIKDMNINGNDIMKEFGLNPWPQIWKLLQKAFEWVLENPKERNQKEKILNYLKNIANETLL